MSCRLPDRTHRRNACIPRGQNVNSPFERIVVGERGLEPPRAYRPLGPEPSASTNSATRPSVGDEMVHRSAKSYVRESQGRGRVSARPPSLSATTETTPPNASLGGEIVPIGPASLATRPYLTGNTLSRRPSKVAMTISPLASVPMPLIREISPRSFVQSRLSVVTPPAIKKLRTHPAHQSA